jgi:hypothetical protein
MSDKLKPGSYIDTQGMGGPMTPEDLAKWKAEGRKQEYKPATIKPRRLFTDNYCKEMSILINEVLDAREGKMNYTSYFDTEEFKHLVTEDEPPYSRPITHDFEQSVFRKEFNKE